MSRYEDEYYIAFEPSDSGRVQARPDRKTGERNYHYEKVPLGGVPFRFDNANKERDLEAGNSWLLTDVLMASGDLLVNNKVHDELKQYAISNLQYYPSSYIDDENNVHDHYWFMTFYQSLDCWCRERSVKLNWKQYYDDDDDESEEEESPDITKYYLDENVLDGISEEKRLMFKMGGASLEYIFCHQKIVDYFVSNKVSGVRFIKVSKFHEGCQFD